MKPHPANRRVSRRGLTLLELLAVLMILAISATIAVVATQGVLDQSRYEATQRTLQEVQAAVLGDANARQPDGSPLISGFVSDIGRLPLVTGTDPKTQLAELWDAGLWSSYPFGTRAGPAGAGYGDIRLPCGWRGPYLRLGVGVADVRDGWGNEFQILPSTPGDAVQSVTWNTVPPYTENLSIDTTSALVTVYGTVTIDGVVPGTATVVLLYPDPSVSVTELVVMPDADPEVGVFTFNDVPVGLRAIRADIDGNVVTKYVYVPRTGLSLNVNYISPPAPPPGP